jgi:hypothetical protein
MKRERTVQRTFVDPYRRRVARVKVTDTLHRASGGAVTQRIGSGMKDIGTVRDGYLNGKGSPWSEAHQPKKR